MIAHEWSEVGRNKPASSSFMRGCMHGALTEIVAFAPNTVGYGRKAANERLHPHVSPPSLPLASRVTFLHMEARYRSLTKRLFLLHRAAQHRKPTFRATHFIRRVCARRRRLESVTKWRDRRRRRRHQSVS